ncbi:MAG: TolC family protein [Vicinamibacteria bacterium]
MSRQKLSAVVLLTALPLASPGLVRGQDRQSAPATPPEGVVLELSIGEAVERALKNNTDLAVEKFNPEASAEDVRSAQGAYDPFLQAQVHKNSTDTPAQSAFSGAQTVNTGTWTWNFGASQLLKTGATWSVAFDNNKQTTNSVFTTYNPSFFSSLNLNITQPLFKNLKTDSARAQLIISKNNRAISDTDFRQTVINTVANVKELYYDVIFNMDNLQAARKSLTLAQKLLNENQIKVKVGTLAPLDVVEAESEVASREEGVITAENALAQAEDSLKAAIFPKNDPTTWSTHLIPTDRPSAEPREVDAAAAVRNALEKRTDIIAARKSLENNDVSLRLAANQTKPQFDLIGAYGGAGQGGTQIIRDGFGGPIISTVPGGYGDALSSVFGRDFPTWTVGVNLSYPLFNRQAKAAQARAAISKDQALASLNRLELQIATQVRSAARNVETNYKRVQSSGAARVLSTRRLDAEEKKFAAGMSTNFLVTQAQRDLAVAEVSELQSIADYRKSIIELDRVQEAGSGTGTGQILSTPTSGANATLQTGLAQISQGQ